MGDSINPLLPARYDIAWAAIVMLLVALVVVALVSIAHTAQRLTSTQAMVWTLLAMFVPVVGPIAWLSIGRRSGLAPAQPRAEP